MKRKGMTINSSSRCMDNQTKKNDAEKSMRERLRMLEEVDAF